MKKYFKLIIIILLMSGTQFLLYFLNKVFISDYNIINSFLDVPFNGYFIYFYNAWYPFILICYFLIYKYDNKLFKPLLATVILTAILSEITFVIYPTEVLRPTIEVNNVTSWLVDLTYKMDYPAVNCLPSLHCIYCFIMGYYIYISKNINKNGKIFIIIFSFMIVLSTLFVKQHIIEDVILSLIYTTISIIIVKIFNKKMVK